MKADLEAAWIQADSGTSDWLREAVRTAMKCEDPIAVVRDCQFLLDFLARRLREIEEAKASRKR